MSSAPNDKFSRLTALRAAVRRARPVNDVGPREAARAAGASRLEEMLGAECRRNRYGEYLAARGWYAAHKACTASAAALSRLAPGAERAAARLEDWLFLDTETTGLAGGSGTYAFLVGLAWWESGGLQVEQYFMRDFGEEHSLLLALAERVAARPVLVTFNGKSFDWPLLETRFRMTRQIRPPAPRAHLDLLHPARQLWRLRLGSVRLSELERHVAGFDRGFDIRSEIIPQVYFDYLRGGPAEPLADVFRHNQMDLRGLGALAGRMLALLDAPEAAEGDALELYGVSRLLGRRGERAGARRGYERALATGLPAAVDRAARRELARLAKRDRDFTRATQLWEEVIAGPLENEKRAQQAVPLPSLACAAGGNSGRSFLDRLDAYEQLAIYYEHRAREPHRAAALTREALAAAREALRCSRLAPSAYSRWNARLARRLARLERKAGGLLGIARPAARSLAAASDVE